MENPGLTLLEQCAKFSLWAEMAAPLLISADVARLSRAAFAILSNSAVVALDRDPLANGDRAVVFFNKSTQRSHASVSLARLGLRPGRYRLENLWTRKIRWTRERVTALIPPHGVVMYRLHAMP